MLLTSTLNRMKGYGSSLISNTKAHFQSQKKAFKFLLSVFNIVIESYYCNKMLEKNNLETLK